MNKKKSSIKNKKEITNRGYLDRNNTVERRGNPRKRLLIVCEGQETEPNYFNNLYKNLNRGHLYIQVKGEGRVTLSLVERAIELRNEDGEYNEVWCVFDRDFKSENKNQQNFNAAIALALRENIRLAISNDAFELWYLLHYEYYISETHRDNLSQKLEERLGKKYNKNLDLYEKYLKQRQQTAIKNAENLWKDISSDTTKAIYFDKQHPEKFPEITDQLIHELTRQHNINPSTTVYSLVQRLIYLSENDQTSICSEI
ncbi:RloB family protein [Planktothrix sp. FACHB-1365]|uniref:RloB family protein n=1 Tax=Planktothrix sp. FACHB-1365 TaxID=2692855 RepID=UPI001685302E|nr:RloB family protein [Planktothrix sp. FACHB-1365]MBD2483482.1 RloB domain-containing protein [Planktothrix sp. FACHB-1365]